MKKKLLILGTNGFLGKNLLSLLNKTKDNVFTIYELDGKKTTDLSEFNLVNKLFKKIKPNYVINSSAFVGGIAFGYKFPASILDKNLQMVLNIFRSSIENNIEMLINPISNCAYPGQLNEYKEELFWEGSPHESVFNYAMTRRIIVALGAAYYKEYNLNSSNIVLSNMYGPHDHFDVERSHALGALIYKIHNAKITNKKTVEIWGTGKPVREWLYAEDGASALIESINLGKGSHFYNIGVNKGISITNLALKISKYLNWNGEFIYNTERPDGALEKRVDGNSFQNKLKWKPKFELDDGLKSTIDWYVKNF